MFWKDPQWCSRTDARNEVGLPTAHSAFLLSLAGGLPKRVLRAVDHLQRVRLDLRRETLLPGHLRHGRRHPCRARLVRRLPRLRRRETTPFAAGGDVSTARRAVLTAAGGHVDSVVTQAAVIIHEGAKRRSRAGRNPAQRQTLTDPGDDAA